MTERVESVDAIRAIKSLLAKLPRGAAVQSFVAAARQFRYADRRELIQRLALQLSLDASAAPRNNGDNRGTHQRDIIENIAAEIMGITQVAASRRIASDIGETK